MASALVAGRAARLFRLGLAGTAWSALALTAAAAENYQVRLRPVPIDAATAAATTGEGTATAVLDGNKLKVTGAFAGLKGAATIAQLHAGPAMGVRGPAIADVTVQPAQSGQINAELMLTASQVEDLRRGRVYLQIHSASAPDGNLWGWLLR